MGTRVTIASVFVEDSGGGPTIATLAGRIRRRVANTRALRRLDYVIASILGTDWRNGVEAAFDFELASESLRFYRVEAVPSLPWETPPGVSDIRYLSDLSNAQALSAEEMLESGGLFAAAASADLQAPTVPSGYKHDRC